MTDTSSDPSRTLTWLCRPWALALIVTLELGLTLATLAAAPARYAGYLIRCQLDQPLLDRLAWSASACAGFTLATTLVTMLAFAASAAGLLIYRSHDAIARLTSLLMVCIGATFTSFHALTPIPAAWRGVATFVQFWGFVVPLTYLCLFPNGRFVPRWLRWAPAVLVAYALVWVINPLAPIHPFRVEAWPLGLLTGVGFIGLGLLAQIYRYRWVATPMQRQQTKWILFGTFVLTMGLLVVYGPAAVFANVLTVPGPARLYYNLLRDAAFQLFLLGMLACFGLSIWRYHLWDIDLVIRRTLLYGGLSLALVSFYLATVIGLQAVLSLWVVGGRSFPAATVVSTLAAAALASPLRVRLQGFIDRRFYRRRYDAARTLQFFAQTLRDETQADLNLLSGRLLAVVDETMQPEHLSLWLRPREVAKR